MNAVAFPLENANAELEGSERLLECQAVAFLVRAVEQFLPHIYPLARSLSKASSAS
jgi:hypothetical protein